MDDSLLAATLLSATKTEHECGLDFSLQAHILVSNIWGQTWTLSHRPHLIIKFTLFISRFPLSIFLTHLTKS